MFMLTNRRRVGDTPPSVGPSAKMEQQRRLPTVMRWRQTRLLWRVRRLGGQTVVHADLVQAVNPDSHGYLCKGLTLRCGQCGERPRLRARAGD